MSASAAWIDACRHRFGPIAVALGGVVAVVVLGGVALMAFRTGAVKAPPELTLPRVGSPSGNGSERTSSAGEPGEGGVAGGEDAMRSTDGVVVVHVAGAVARPGVYRLAIDARLADAIEAAGGAAPEADVDSVNLAAKLSDGERIYLPRRGEEVAGPAGSPAGARSGSPGGPLDLNSATQDQLEELPGVGPATALAILEYREQHGRFRSVDELLEVRGIGDAKFAAIRPKVRVR